MHSVVKRIEKVNGEIKEYWDITLTRGDSLFLQLSLTRQDEPYIPVVGDSIRFAMKAKYTDEEPVLVKQIPIDTLLLEFEPEDTKPLKMKKTFVYDLELTDTNGYVDTFIEGTFTVGEEVL